MYYGKTERRICDGAYDPGVKAAQAVVNVMRILPEKQDEDLPDPGDALFPEIALAADALLVTGNLKHFPVRERHGARVESPAAFMRRFTL